MPALRFVAIVSFAVLAFASNVVTVARATTVNAAAKEIDARIVYWGPVATAASLTYLHKKTEPYASSLARVDAAQADVLSFNFLPKDLGPIRDHSVRLHVWSAPTSAGIQLAKLVPDGVDGVVFVVDAGASATKANAASLADLIKQVTADGYDFDKMYVVVQIMGSGTKGAVPTATVLKRLGLSDRPHYDADAKIGTNIFPALKSVTSMILTHIRSTKQAPNKLPDVKLYKTR